MKEIAHPATMPLPADAPRPAPIRVTWPEDWNLTDTRLRSYEQCARRFFYTHVLGLGSARKTTAFTQTHDCLYELIRWLAAARVEGAVGTSARPRRSSNASGPPKVLSSMASPPITAVSPTVS